MPGAIHAATVGQPLSLWSKAKVKLQTPVKIVTNRNLRITETGCMFAVSVVEKSDNRALYTSIIMLLLKLYLTFFSISFIESLVLVILFIAIVALSRRLR